MQLRNLIMERARQLKPSKSKFRVEVGERYVSGQPIPSKDDQSHIADDHIGQLLKKHYSESLVGPMRIYQVDVTSTTNNCIYIIVDTVNSFISANPISSKHRVKLCKWMQGDVTRQTWNNTSFNNDVGEGFYLLYKYILSFCNESLVSSDEKHTKNCYAVLFAMMEKYGTNTK